ncbi:hypothetical protein QQP08_021682 [Theobroma cacao]|nr:hypothetical protein QQP08_021682 [Theobroma cacao]
MTGEEAAGPPGPKVLRLLYFAGAAFIFTIGINKWRELERKSGVDTEDLANIPAMRMRADV